MDTLIVGFFVKLLDIPAASIGLLGGWFARRWYHLVIVAFIGGSIGEMILFFRQDTSEFDPVVWLVGVAACFAWAYAAFWVRSLRERSD